MIGQLNVVVDSSTDTIAGYNNIEIEKLPSITNGYVSDIVFTTLDKLDSDSRVKLFIESLKKITPGGQLTIKFLNLAAVASKIKSNHIDGIKFTQIISGLSSFWTESDFLDILSNIGGYRLIKILNEDLYIVATIEKNK